MTLASTRAKLELASRREGASAAAAGATKRLPPARVVGHAGAVVGINDPARRAHLLSSALLDSSVEGPSLRPSSSGASLKPLLRLHQELAREGVLERVETAAPDLLTPSSRTASPPAIDVVPAGQPLLHSSRSSPVLKTSPRAHPTSTEALLERAATAMHRERVPLPSFAELREDALRRTFGGMPPAPYTMSDASGLRVSKSRRAATPAASVGAPALSHPTALHGGGTGRHGSNVDELGFPLVRPHPSMAPPHPATAGALSGHGGGSSAGSSIAGIGGSGLGGGLGGGGGGSRAVPAHAPSTRSEAVRLGELLDSLLAVEQGGWDHQCQVHDTTFAEAILQVASHCAERGELLQRLRKFTQLCVRTERECRNDLRRTAEELRAASARADREAARADGLEAEVAASAAKLDMLRAGMVRLKMLRAIHGRKLAAAELRCKELEREVEELKMQVADAFEQGMREAEAQEALGLVGADGKKKKGKGQSGVDMLAAQLESLKQALQEKEVAVRKMAAEKIEAEAQLKASEQEVSALMNGVMGGSLTPKPGGGGGFGGGGGGRGGGKGGGKGGKGGGKRLSGKDAAKLPAEQRALYDNMSEDEQAAFANMSEAERAAYASMSSEERARFMRQKGVVGEGLSAAAVAALPADQKAMYDNMSEAERAAFASMSDEERARFASMSPEERAKEMRQMGVVGEALSAEAVAALPAEQKKLYNGMSEAERAAFGSMSEAERAAYMSMSAEERAAYMRDTMGVSEIKVAGGGGGGGGGLSAEELANLSPEERAKYESMSAAERAAFASMTDAQRKAFGNMSADERSKMMHDLGYPEFFEGSGGPGTRDVSVQADAKTFAAGRGRGKGGAGGAGAGGAHDGKGADGGGSGAGDDSGGRKRRRRNRGKPMITSLKGAKAVPAWMLHKTVGTMMQARVEYELEMAARGELEEDNQDFGEFVEDRFVELYGLKKIAETNLRDTLKGLKQSSETHTRLAIFRAVTALVPGDDEGETDAQPFSNAAAIFMRRVLGQLVKIFREDHLSGLKGDAFWAHYSKADVLHVPAAYIEKIIERLSKQISYLKEHKEHTGKSAKGGGGEVAKEAEAEPSAPSRPGMMSRENAGKDLLGAAEKNPAQPRSHGATQGLKSQADAKVESEIIRAIKSLEAALADHAKKELPLTADKMTSRGDGEQKVKDIKVGDDVMASKPTNKGNVGRCCIDSFLHRALEHWTRLEDLEEEMLLRAYSTWDLNGDSQLQLSEFTHMVKYANTGVSQRKITRAFLAASGGNEAVDRERLGPILLAYGLALQDRPSDYDAEAIEAMERAAAEAAAAAESAPAEEEAGPAAAGEELATDYRDMWQTMSTLGKIGHAFRPRRKQEVADAESSGG